VTRGPASDVNLDPKSAALYAIVAICLVMIGALLTPGAVSIDQRAAVLAGIIGVLLLVGLRFRVRRDDGGE
jgi:hypothetical protein